MPYNHAHTRSLGPRHYALTSRPPDHQPQNTAPLFRTPATPPPCSHIGLSSPYMARIELKNSSYSAAVGSASSGSSMSASGPGSGSGSASSSVGSGAPPPSPPSKRRARFALASCSSASWSALSPKGRPLSALYHSALPAAHLSIYFPVLQPPPSPLREPSLAFWVTLWTAQGGQRL